MPHWSSSLWIQHFSPLYNSPLNPSDKLCIAPYFIEYLQALCYFSFSLGPCGQILLFNLPPFISCLSIVIILFAFLEHLPKQCICHNEAFRTECNTTDGSFQASIPKDYYLPFLQGNMSGYVAKTLQWSVLHCKTITDSKPTTYFIFSCILCYFLCYFTTCIFPIRIFLKIYYYLSNLILVNYPPSSSNIHNVSNFNPKNDELIIIGYF